jgi:hypothetical protein
MGNMFSLLRYLVTGDAPQAPTMCECNSCQRIKALQKAEDEQS